MKLEKGEITNSQLTILIVSFLQGMILTVNFTYALTRQGSWIAAATGFVISIPIACLHTFIAKRFPGQNLIQINDAVFGRYLGKIFSACYIWFFFQLVIHYMYFFNSFWITYIMPETPRVAFLFMLAFVCAMAVRKGLEVIARCSLFFAVMVAAMVVFVTALLTGEMNPSNLLPMADFSAGTFIQSVHIAVSIFFCDIVVFLMIFPYTTDKLKITKPVLTGMGLSALQLVVVALRDAAVLGLRLPIVTLVSFAVSRLINIANILTRLDILIAITLLITFFIKITVFYYVTVLSIAQVLKLRSYLPLVVPIGALCIAIASNLYESDMAQVYAGAYVWPFNAVVYEVLLPLVTFVVIGVRKLPKKEGAPAK